MQKRLILLLLTISTYVIAQNTGTFSGQIIGATTIFIWVFVTSFLLWLALKALIGIRVSKEEEEDGVDISECGLEAYPEFVVK